jgi:hypothetical protein
MPFYTPSNDPQHQIDYNKYQPIYVYSHTDMDGNIRPLSFIYITEDGIRITLKIDEIKYTKDINGGFLYNCIVTNYGKQQEVILTYYVKQHIWVMEK